MIFDTKIAAADDEAISAAAELIKSGSVVGMPTETVYGLAADACSEAAVKRIFAAKGRPQDNPLIVHFADFSDALEYVDNVPELAFRLAEAFVPGPLTMVLPKRDIIPYVTSGGLDTIGVRIPAHNTARELIRRSGVPIAAPSANLSGSPSPTTAMHVFTDMNGRIPFILDGGSCHVGVESTVVSFEGSSVRLLRPGFISLEELREVAGDVIADKGITEMLRADEKVRSPGMKYKHYSPKAEVIILSGSLESFTDYMSEHNLADTYALVFDSDAESYPYNCLCYGDTPEQQAQQLFSRLREFDEIGAARVYARCPEKTGVGLAVYNRLLRAAGFRVIRLC